MPLARIITRYPEHASELAQQLRLEGFAVELADPEEVDLPPSDLEIDFEICNPDKVLDRAWRRATELGADVAVASGALDLAPEPAAIAPIEFQPAAIAEVSVGPQAVQPPPIAEGQSARDNLSHELPAYNAHFANLGGQLRESLNDLGLAADELRQRLVENLRSAAGSARNRMATAKSNLASLADSLASRAYERMQQKAAAAQADRERRLELGLQAETQPSPPQAPSTLQEKEQRQEPQEEKKEEKKKEPATAAAATQQPLPALPAVTQARSSTRAHGQRMPLQLRGILTGAVAASALFVIGMALANIHPQSPLPASITRGSGEQLVPFGAVIVQGTPARPKVNVGQQPGVPAPATLNPQERIPSVKQGKTTPLPHQQ